MAKTIYLYYQDCPMCGARQGWGEAQTNIANDYGFKIVKVPFFKSGAKDIIIEGARKGMHLPFFTDGEGKFAMDISEFIETPVVEEESKPKTKSKSKKAKK